MQDKKNRIASVVRRVRTAAVLAVAATALCLAVASTASAGTGINHNYCTNVTNGNGCFTPFSNLPNWTFYNRAEMMGYHCASGMSYLGMNCGTANFVYSHCWTNNGVNPKYGFGVNQSGVTRNMDVWLFHSTGGDCV